MEIELLEIISEDKNIYGELENLEFEIGVDGNIFYVECYAPDLEHEDNYVIHVYKTESRSLSVDTEVAKGFTDSTGGSYIGSELTFYDDDIDYSPIIEKINEIIFNHMQEVISHDEIEESLNKEQVLKVKQVNESVSTLEDLCWNYGFLQKGKAMFDAHNDKLTQEGGKAYGKLIDFLMDLGNLVEDSGATNILLEKLDKIVE